MDSQVDLTLTPPEDEPKVEEMQTGLAGGDTRFQILARVNDISTNRAITLKVDLPDDDLSIATWIPVYSGANWHEREAAEMFGIDFVGHPNLRNLYLPGAFEGHPMRKDFALLSRRIKPWPGIVDVEQMPGEDDDDAEGSDS
jgi:NADH-quinone oxidoreductase subunit C